MEIICIILLIAYVLMLIIDIIISSNQQKAFYATLDLLSESQHKRLELLIQIARIRVAIEEAEKSKEMYRDTIKKIKEIVNDRKSNN